MRRPIPTFGGEVKDGKLTIYDREGMEKHISTLSGPVVITVKKRKKSRSDRQNAYYWGVVIKILSDELGYEPEEMHQALKQKFLGIEAKPLPTTKSTASLTTLEFIEYTDQIIRWSSQELNIVIPDPNSVDYDKL
jgi:hypothetical protein